MAIAWEDDKMIPLFRPHFRVEESLESIRGTLEKGWTGQGDLTDVFEDAWSKFVGRKNCVMLNSASAALHLAIESMKIAREWGPDSEVISTPLTFVSTNHAILWSGLVPVLADVDDDLCLSPESVLASITQKTKAVIFVAIGGGSGRIGEIEKICRDRGIALILDASHASGSTLSGRAIGIAFDAVCYSFQAVKNLPTGDSGLLSMLLDGEHAIVKRLSWLGISESTFARTKPGGYKWEYDVEYAGYKYNANSVMAALALVSLKYLNEDNQLRRSMVHQYAKLIGKSASVQIISQSNSEESARHLFQVYVRDRKRVASAMAENRIGIGVHYRSNCEYPMYQHFKEKTPNATHYSEGIVSLPMYIGLTTDEQSKIVQVLVNASL